MASWTVTTTSPEATERACGRAMPLALSLLVISVFINYVDRGNLSIAASLLKNELGLSASQLGILFSAFFWTYSAMLFVCGWGLLIISTSMPILWEDRPACVPGDLHPGIWGRRRGQAYLEKGRARGKVIVKVR